jgi:peptidyl-prolyl cis-trans isomerase C
MTSASCSVRSVVAGAARVSVSVNGIAIAHDLISREAQNHPAAKPIDAWQAAARALAVRELLLQEARRLGLSPAPIADDEGRRETDEEALVRGLIETEVATPTPDEASCRRYYERNTARFTSADIFECAHIFIAARRDQPEAFAAAGERAAAILAQLREAPGQFETLAATHSDCPSRASGGNLGQITTGATTPEFERGLLEMQTGEIGPVVESRYGFHIIRLERRIAGALLPFEVVHARIAAYLGERSQRLAIAQYVARLASKAKLTGVELPTPGDLRVH